MSSIAVLSEASGGQVREFRLSVKVEEIIMIGQEHELVFRNINSKPSKVKTGIIEK